MMHEGFEKWLNEVEDGKTMSRKENILTEFLDGDYDEWGSLMSLLEKTFMDGIIHGVFLSRDEK